MDLACPACAFTTTLPEGQAPPEGARVGYVAAFTRIDALLEWVKS